MSLESVACECFVIKDRKGGKKAFVKRSQGATRNAKERISNLGKLPVAEPFEPQPGNWFGMGA